MKSRLPRSVLGRIFGRPRVLFAASVAALALLASCAAGDSDSEDLGEANAALVLTPSQLFRRVVPTTGPPQAFMIAHGVELSADQFLALYAAQLWNLGTQGELVAAGPPRRMPRSTR